ncbi:hypothetical protein DFJ63DRAFT_264065 [Scheffersomyces coipomensis]|uniref:uncharacterized protein n=1 Tax=Scheffersomyces coipomensis TaxID=1788519 RepID=UPI00315CF73A
MNKRQREDTNEDEVIINKDHQRVDIVCNTPPCNENPIIFSDYAAYENHITTNHTFLCEACHKRFPSQLILNIHIDENHNPFNKIKQENGEKVFKCFAIGCTKLCRTPKNRRLHMIEKHNYPKDFKFNIINRGL